MKIPNKKISGTLRITALAVCGVTTAAVAQSYFAVDGDITGRQLDENFTNREKAMYEAGVASGISYMLRRAGQADKAQCVRDYHNSMRGQRHMFQAQERYPDRSYYTIVYVLSDRECELS